MLRIGVRPGDRPQDTQTPGGHLHRGELGSMRNYGVAGGRDLFPGVLLIGQGTRGKAGDGERMGAG